MKKIITALAIAVCLNINAQITIGNFEKKEENKKVEASVIKPTVYDTLTNIEASYDYSNQHTLDPHTYEKYIGMQFYHPPSIIPGMYSLPYDAKVYEASANSPKFTDKYYILLNVLVSQYPFKSNSQEMIRIMNSLPPKLNTALRDAYYESSSGGPLVLFQMKDIKTGDTLYCARLHVFILVPYFIKQKSLYENKILISVNPDYQQEDLITNENVTVKENSRWKCSEVTLLKRSQVYPKEEVRSFYFRVTDNIEDEYAIFYIEVV